ncbi:MAG: hypothetical protein GC159_05905 [Phycisphaera sp.]|nr:hypothetical protein [Phycisphaera sp.]
MGFSVRKTFDGVEIRTGSPIPLKLFGLVFFAAGMGILYAKATGRMSSSGGSAGDALAPYIVGGVFGLFGFVTMGWRSGLRVNHRRRTLTTWWGVVVPLFSKDRDLEAVRAVHVCKEVRRTSNGKGGSSSKTVYPVRLVFDGSDRHEIKAPGSPIVARQLAEAVAHAADAPMHNAIGGESVIRQPDQLDWSLREHLLHAGDAPPEPTAPSDTTLRVEPERDGYAIDVPPLGVKSGIVLVLPAMGMAVIPLVIFFNMGDARPPLGFVLFACALFGVPFLGAALWMLHRTVVRTRIRLTPDELTITRRAPWWKSTRTLKCDDVEELTVSTAEHPLAALIAAGSVTAVTDARIEQFGQGLATDDLRYLADLIRHTVCR